MRRRAHGSPPHNGLLNNETRMRMDAKMVDVKALRPDL